MTSRQGKAVDSIERQFKQIGKDLNICDEVVVTADKPRTSKARKYSNASPFIFDEQGQLICPAGHAMRQEAQRSQRWRIRNYTGPRRGYTGRGYSGRAEHCPTCALRSECIRGKKTTVRNITTIGHGETYIRRNLGGCRTFHRSTSCANSGGKNSQKLR